MVYAIDIVFDAVLCDEVGVDNCKLIKAMGCEAQRVHRPVQIKSDFEWAIEESKASQVPVLLEVMIDRFANGEVVPAASVAQ